MATNYINGSTPNFTVLATAQTRARERANAATTDDALLEDLLKLSSVGTASEDTPADAVLYRPFLTAALFLEQKQSVLISGDGAVFRRQLEEAHAMRRMQANIDTTNGAVVGADQNALYFGLTAPKSQNPDIGWY